VRIKVLDIDRDRQRISLGLKQTQEDPWQKVVSTHRPGDVLEGAVTKVVAFGAFVEILPGVEGLVHISELADHHVESPSEVVEPGTSLNVKILEIDEERRRLSLSIKRVEGQNMPMQDLGAQIAEASGETAEGSDPTAAGPVEEDASSSSQAAGYEPPSTPPADEASEEGSAESPAEPAEDDADAPSEGESVGDRPDSPDDLDEAGGGAPDGRDSDVADGPEAPADGGEADEGAQPAESGEAGDEGEAGDSAEDPGPSS
jgi:small subunit ribosomal protein S1